MADLIDENQIPAGARNVWGFSAANAVAFQITLGAPTVLYAMSLGASATVLGLITALTPLLSIFQIPAAYFMARVGYRRFILAGWGLRNLFVAAIAVLPLLVFLDAPTKLVALLSCLFAFNLLRGIASGAWLPWISDIIPEPVRGRFLSHDQTFQQSGSLVALLVASLTLGGSHVAPGQYSVAFFISMVAGFVSLAFINRVPETGVAPLPSSQINQPVPWRAIISFPPFRRLVLFNVLYQFAIGSLSVFSVAFLRDSPQYGYTSGQILLASSSAFLGAMVSVQIVGRVIDRTGSRPILRAALALYSLLLAGWAALAGGLVPAHIAALLIPGLFFGYGVATGNFNIANLRLTMSTMPPTGRNHFFAYYTVITSLSLGFAPILWGLLIDALTHGDRLRVPTMAGFHLGPFAVYFLSLFVCALVALLAVGRLREEKSVPMDHLFREISLALGLKRLAKMIQR
jgi:MFS family permease